MRDRSCCLARNMQGVFFFSYISACRGLRNPHNIPTCSRMVAHAGCATWRWMRRAGPGSRLREGLKRRLWIAA